MVKNKLTLGDVFHFQSHSRYFYCVLHAGYYILIHDEWFSNCLAAIMLIFATRCLGGRTNPSLSETAD